MTKPKPPKLVTMAVFTTITIIFWVFFSIYEAITADYPASVSEKMLEPISPSLDNEVLKSLEGKIYFNEDEIDGFTIVATPTPVIDKSQETLPEETAKEGEQTTPGEGLEVSTTPIPEPTLNP